MRFALLVLYAAGTLAAPVLDERYPVADIKIVECSGSRFRPGATFEYEYNGETVHRVEGTTEKETGLRLNANVLITHLEGCAFHMRLTKVGLHTKSMTQKDFTESAESAAYRAALTKHDLLFTMKGNGVTSVRPHSEESVEMLNIKRGILSTLNLDETATTESDVHGTCGTRILKEGDVVVKAKQLSDCSDRVREEIGIQSSTIKTSSNMKPLDSKSLCKYTLKDGDIFQVVCEESHLFRPFSGSFQQKTSGALTTVKQTLNFVTKRPVANLKIERSRFTTTKSVIYDHSTTVSDAATLPPAIEAVMKRLVVSSAKQTSANEFTSLVKMLRVLEKREMSALWNKYFDCTASNVCAADDTNMKDLYKQYMLDAIAYCGTPTCVSVVKKVTVSGDVDGERANMFLQSIALVAKTTTTMIRDILDIAEKKPSRQVFLTLGTLINRHCSKSPQDCSAKSGSAVVDAENFLVKTLGDCSGQENHERVEEILLVLKAIGNAQRPASAQSSIVRCAVKSQHSNITLASFEALRGMPCGDALGELQGVVSNENLDADKRIHAFRTAMKCPTKTNLEFLTHQYNLETNKQLTSYMWTYFTNLLESTNPEDKQAIATLTAILNETPLKTTDLSTFHYSKHFEKSLYVDSIETGATAKADLVFHPDGFLPKTASFDMSAKVMGVPMDIVQTAVGIDGVENVLENMFGPDGAIPKDFALKMFDWTLTAEKLKELAGKEEEKSRTRRAAGRTDMPMVSDIHDAVNKKPTQPSGFMSVRIMGQEVRMMSYDDIYAMIDQIDNMNVIQLLVAAGKGGKKTFSKSLMFLEMTHSVPTGLGLPLKLSLSGSTVGTVDMEGKFDIRNMFWGKGAMNVNGFVKTSAVVEISGSMSTESMYVSTGMRVVSNMMVEDMLKGSILYKSGQMLKINLDTPEKPVQLFKMASTPFMFLNENYHQVEGVPRVLEKDACFKSQLIGYGLCTSVRVPLAFREYEAPYFPLTGPAHFGISYLRGDDRLTTFQFLTTMTKQGNGLTGLIEFSTPGAVYERKLSGRMSYTDIDNTKSLTISTEKFGRTGALKVSYNTVSMRTEVETKHNFFTTKDITTRILFFNEASATSKQMGVQLTADYDWYKFKHVTKFVAKDNKYLAEIHTEYLPKKSVTAALEFDIAEKQMRAIFDINQVRQAVEIIGRLENSANEKGVTFTFVHVPTQKTAQLYTGYKTAVNKKEIVTSLNIMGKEIKNVVGWYRNGGIQRVEDLFSFQGKTAKIAASWENRNDDVAIQLLADLFGKKAVSTVVYSDKGAQKFIDLSARLLDKEVSTSVVVTNTGEEKSVVLRLNSVAKPMETSIGYYEKNGVVTLKAAAKGFDNRAKVFVSVDLTQGYRTAVGFGFNKYTGGVKGTFADNKGCASVFYKTPVAEKTAVRACGELKQVSATKQFLITLELPLINQKLILDNELLIEAGHSNIQTKIVHNERQLALNTLDAVYRGLTDASVAVDLKSIAVNGGFKVFSKKPAATAATEIGMEVSTMGKTVLLLNTYEPGKIATSVVVNGKPLPVSTQLTYVLRETTCETSFAIKVGTYSLKSTGTIHYTGKYGYELSSVVVRESASLFGLTLKEYVDWTTGKKVALVQKAGVIINGKEYVYGWTLGYENLSSGAKRVHALTAQIQYSNTRSSTVTLTLADSDNKSSLNVDIEYIPTKRVSHFITYNKNMNQLDASVEFLPNMFARLSSRLEKGEGYMLQTTASLEWTGFKRSITIINSFVNNDKTFMISTNLARDLSIGLRVNKLSPKSIALFANFFGNRAQLETWYEKMNLGMKLVVNGNTIFQVKGGYDQWAKTVRILAAQQEKVFLDLKSSYNSVKKSFNLALAGLTKWGGIYVTQREHRNILTISVLGKPSVKLILNTKDMSLTIHTLQYPRFSISWKWISKSKTLQMTLKTLKNRMMVNLRTDWSNKILAVNGFLNKERVGAKLFFVKRSLILKVTLSPRNIVKVTFSKGNNQLKVNLQRIVKGKTVSQAAFAYAFNTKLSEVMFKYNAELVEKIVDFFQPILANTVADIKGFLERIKIEDRNLVELSKSVQANIVEFLKKIDQSIQSFDLEPFRKTLTESGTKLFKQFSDLTVQLLKTLADGLDTIKANTPKTVAKVRQLVKSAKKMYTRLTGDMRMRKQELDQKVKMVIEMVERLLKHGEELLITATKEGRVLVQMGIARGQEMVVKGQAVLKTLSADLQKRLVPIKLIIDEFVKATTPIVEKFVQLAKDFKIRGMRLEDIAVKAKAEGEKLIKEYIAKIKVIIARLEKATMTRFVDARTKAIELWNKYKADSYKTLREVEEYALNLRVPYTNQNVKQIVERIRAEIARLVEWARALDVNQVIADTRKTVTGIITAKTEVLKKRMDELVGRLNALRVYVPRVTREMYEKVVAVVTKYIKEVTVLVNQAAEFAKPMREYFTLVEASVSKHFGPLLDHITLPQFLNLIQNMPDIQVLFDKEIRPILTKLMPAYKNALKQIRSIKVGGFHLGPLFDMQLREVRGQLEDAMTTIKKEMISLRKAAYEAKSVSPKWFVQTSIEASVRVINEIVDYMKYLYKNRDVVIGKAMKKVEAVQNRLDAQYSRITAKSFDQVTEDILKLSEDSVTLTTGELSNVIRQLIAMDISGPTWKALTDIDVASRMTRMGVDWKIRRALRYAKQANVTGIVLNAITRIQAFINLGIKETSIKAIAMYEQMDKTYKYLKSIPKKDYEAWLKEAAAFTMSTRDLVELKIVKIYETSKIQAVAARKFLATINELEMSKYQNMAMDVFDKATKFVTVIGEKSTLVYNDLEQPTINVLTHYKSVIVPLIEKYYTIITAKLTTEFIRISARLQEAVVQLQTRAEDMFRDLQKRVVHQMSQIKEILERITASAVAEYKQFMAKYGHLTWEQVYDKVQAGGIQELNRLNARIKMYYKQIVARVNELRATVTAKATEAYKILLSEAKALIGTYEAELEKLRSEVMTKVEELRTQVMAYYSQYEKRFNHYKELTKVEIDRLRGELDAMVNEVRSRAIALYNANKDKTMKQIVEEIKAIFNAAYLKHKQIVEAIAEKKFDEAKKLIGEAQAQVLGQYRNAETNVMTQYRSLETRFNTKVWPELKSAYKKLLIAMPELQGIIDEVVAEGKSIAEQMVRDTIIMGETITKAYGPLVTAAKDFLMEYVEILKAQLPEIVAKWEKFLEKALDEMEIVVRAWLESFEEQVTKLITKARVYIDDIIKATDKLIQVTLARIEKKIEATIEEIRNNPEVKEYLVMVETKLAQLKKMIKELIKNLETNPTLIKMRADIKQKVDELKLIFNEEFKRITSDPRFKQLTLDIQMSVDQIQAYVKAGYAEMRKTLRELIAGRTAFVNAKLDELKKAIYYRVKEVRMMVAYMEIQLQPLIREAVALLKQISKSGKFTVEQIQKYMSPQMEEMIKTVTYFANMFPKFVEQAVLYVKTNPEEALSNAVKVTKNLIDEILVTARTAKTEDLEKIILEFYTTVVGRANEVYTAVTDEWTKKTVIKIREFLKTVIADLAQQTLDLQAKIETLPEVIKMYYTKAMPILKKMINGKIGDLETLFKQYANLVTVTVAESYSKVKTILEKHMKTIEALATDCTALALKYLEISVETMKKYWDTLPFKAILDNQFWSDVAAEIKSHELFRLAAQTANVLEAKVKILARKLINIVVKFIKTRADVIENELKALKTEALKQVATMTTQGRRMYRRSIDEADVMVARATATFNALVADVEAQYGTLLSDITARYKDIIKQITIKYRMLVETAQKVYETATIGQIVHYVEKETAKLSTQFEVLQTKYVAELKAFVEEYRIKISKMSAADQMAMIVKRIQAFGDAYIALMDPYYQKFQQFVKKYKTLVVAKYEELTNKMMNEFETMSRTAIAQYKTLSALVVAKYDKYVAEMKATYGKDFEKMMSKVNKMMARFNKMSAEMIATYEKMSGEIMMKYKSLRGDLIKVFDEVDARVEIVRLSFWKRVGAIRDELRSKLTSMKKMTVQESVDLLMKFPAELKTVTQLTITEVIQTLEKMRSELTSELRTYLEKAEILYNNLKKTISTERARVQTVLKQLKSKVEDIIDILKPYFAELKHGVLKVQGEVVDTAKFVYKYYNLGEKFQKLEQFLLDEMKKIIEQSKTSLPELEKMVRQSIEDYRHQLEMASEAASGVATGYARDAQDFTYTTYNSLRTTTAKTGDQMLRAIHKGLVYWDTLDQEILVNKLRDLVDFVKKHITVIQKEGQVIIKMIHPNFRPTIDRYTNAVKTQAQLTYDQLQAKGQQLLNNIEAELPKLQAKITALKKQIREAVMKSTFDIRRDLNISYKVNKNIVLRLYKVVSRVVAQRFATQMQRFTELKDRLITVTTNGQLLTEAYWKQFTTLLQQAYGNSETIIMDISKAPTPKAMYEKIIAYINQAVTLLKTRYQPLVISNLGNLEAKVSAYLMNLKTQFTELKEKDLAKMFVEYMKSQDITRARLDATIALLKKTVVDTTAKMEKVLALAQEQMKTGYDLKMAMKLQGVWERLIEMISSVDIRGTMCKIDPELCQLVDEGVEVHKVLLNKYLAYLSVGKAQVDRVIRELNTKVQDTTSQQKYLATAMIMNNHILTFDGKLYDMVNFPKTKKGSPSPCSYLLARDFQDKKFTLSKLDNAIIVETPQMTVKIRNDGQTKTTVGNGMRFGLPVQSGKSTCIRVNNLIMCHFVEQGLKVTVDLKNFFTSISVSGWYKGKSQGLLGTLNNEVHDDWRLPNNMITTNINEFLNAYELSGKSVCKLNPKADNAKQCDGKTSKMCAVYFDAQAATPSPFAGFFKDVDPKPFMEACVRDTKCKRMNKKAHCGVVAAYNAVLRTKGFWVPQANECMMEKGRRINEVWTVKPTKMIDIVVMVSQHTNMNPLKRAIAATLLNLHKNLRTKGKFNVKYALVGFGGSGVHEAAHVHSLRRGQSIFGFVHDVRTEIKSMPFEGRGDVTNDGYHAIMTANRLKFRPGAEKVFIMFNTVPHKSHPTGPSYDETRFIMAREANAPLFVFDSINFQKFAKHSVGRVIGQTEHKVYTTTNLKGITSKDLEMPASEFRQLVLISKGGLFSNTIKYPAKTAVSLHDAVTRWVKSDMTTCKRCVLRGSWTGQSRAVCHSVQC